MTDTSDAALIAFVEKLERDCNQHARQFADVAVDGGDFHTAHELLANAARFRALAARLRDGWRAMDDAPRDGTRIITYSPAAQALGFRAIRINWHENDQWQKTNAKYWPPTHWCALPAPPEAGS